MIYYMDLLFCLRFDEREGTSDFLGGEDRGRTRRAHPAEEEQLLTAQQLGLQIPETPVLGAGDRRASIRSIRHHPVEPEIIIKVLLLSKRVHPNGLPLPFPRRLSS